MCLLILAKKSFPSREVLSLGNQHNPHGIGIAWTENGRVKWKKGITLEELQTMEKRVSGRPHMIHFRLATVGGKRPELCHPFSVDERASTALEGEADAVLMHNGHWGNWSKELLLAADYNTELPNDPWSDTRAMAFLAHAKGMKFLDSVKEKVVVLHGDGNYDVYQPHLFTAHEDLLLSNNIFFRTSHNNKPSVSNTYDRVNYGYDDFGTPCGTSCTTDTKNWKSNRSPSTIYEGFKDFTGFKLPAPCDI